MEAEGEKYSSIYFELSNLSKQFLEKIFKDELEVIEFNDNFLRSNGFKFHNEIDYTQLFRFIKSEYNTIYSLDPKIIDALLEKFYRDLEFLFKFYTIFKDKRSNIKSIYSNFLSKNGGLDSIGVKIFEKKLNDQEKSELNEILKDEFESSFIREYEDIDKDLKLIINTKSYYFDNLLWKEAKKSKSVVEFFKQSVRLNIKNSSDLSIKIFILQYLNSVDLAQVKNPNWHEYLQKVVKVIE